MKLNWLRECDPGIERHSSSFQVQEIKCLLLYAFDSQREKKLESCSTSSSEREIVDSGK
jgi:hypothetical protein